MSYIKECINIIKKINHKIVDAWFLKELLVEHVWNDETNKKLYKVTYALKSKGYLINLRKDLYLIKKESEQIEESEIIEQYYRKLLSLHCQQKCGTKRYIGWIKALEIHNGNTEPNQSIHIYNDVKHTQEIIALDYVAYFKAYQIKSGSFYQQTRHHTQDIKLDNNKCKIASLELSILESLYNISSDKVWYVRELIIKTFKKQKKLISLEQLEKIVRSQKHHTSINKLHDITRTIDPTRAKELMTIIKKVSYVL